MIIMNKKEQIINELKRVAKLLGTDSFSQREFSNNSKISTTKVKYHFGSWGNGMKSANLIPLSRDERLKAQYLKQTISDEDLLLDLIRLRNEFGENLTESLVNSNGKYSSQPYRKRWKNIKNAIQVAVNRFSDHIINDKKEFVEQHKTPQVKLVPNISRPREGKKRRTIGEPISFRGLSHAPINEQGVVYLFGMVSNELGFQIETVRQAFPDCEGKRCYDKEKNLWEHVRIEFEYKSSNFKEHGHCEEECDLIVCWIHDWKDCPLEVLDLNETIKYLD